MATAQEKAELYNDAIAQGIPENEALELAGLTANEVATLYTTDDGVLVPLWQETGGLNVTPDDVPVQREGDVLVDLNTGEEYPIDPDSGFVEVNGLLVSPEDLPPGDDPQVPDGGLVEFTPNGPQIRTADELAAQQSEINARVAQARVQRTLNEQRRQANDGDWRVKLRLGPGSQVLYNAPEAANSTGILYPLYQTGGVIFPYTPRINMVYKANYQPYELTHSNYRGFFYQGSSVEDIQLEATFTAQDTAEANYLLAVIHFFKSVTKMFYGQDSNAGTPPPMVFLQGLGEFQFNLHPCVVAQFNYNLPNDVDYIRARTTNIDGTNLLQRRDRQNLPTNPFTSAWARLTAAGLPKGAKPIPPAPPTLGTNSPTYVPTRLDMTLVLHPIQSRKQVSNVFSLQKFSNGNLIKGGTDQPGAFW